MGIAVLRLTYRVVSPADGGIKMTVRTPALRDIAWLAVPLLFGGAMLASMLEGGLTGSEIATFAAITGVLYFLIVAAAFSGAFRHSVGVAKMMELLAKAKGIPYTRRLQRCRQGRFEAIESLGQCPLGVKKGYVWNVHRSGKMDAPICMAAVSALDNSGSAESEACVCPYGENKVAFARASA
jgi:hypothetical protein